jgi:NAD(P)H-dependent FMN reductase
MGGVRVSVKERGMPLLQIVTASVREGRKGHAVAAWFEGQARAHGAFEIESIDLAEVNLPMLAEPEHPRLQHYHFDDTKAWSARISRADAFVFVTPEYNYSPAPALLNALDHLLHEWAYKPVGFVSYGGVSGGTRAAQATKLVVTSLKMMPLPEAVIIPFFARYLDAETDAFEPEEHQAQAAATMLTELRRWADALRVLRTPAG